MQNCSCTLHHRHSLIHPFRIFRFFECGHSNSLTEEVAPMIHRSALLGVGRSTRVDTTRVWDMYQIWLFMFGHVMIPSEEDQIEEEQEEEWTSTGLHVQDLDLRLSSQAPTISNDSDVRSARVWFAMTASNVTCVIERNVRYADC